MEIFDFTRPEVFWGAIGVIAAVVIAIASFALRTRESQKGESPSESDLASQNAKAFIACWNIFVVAMGQAQHPQSQLAIARRYLTDLGSGLTANAEDIRQAWGAGHDFNHIVHAIAGELYAIRPALGEHFQAVNNIFVAVRSSDVEKISQELRRLGAPDDLANPRPDILPWINLVRDYFSEMIDQRL